MPTSYTSLLGLALPVTGELAGTWGDTVNNYITSYVDASVAGTQTISGSQTAVTLSVTNGSSLVTAGSGATGSAQFQIINCTGNPAGLLTITAPASSRQYIIINATSTNQSVKIVGAGPTTGVTLVAGEKAHVAWNGSDFVKIATQNGSGDFVTVDTTNLEVTNIKAKDGTASMTLADTTGIITLSATAGTANGVLYLNGSRAVTSGSALTFDGTGLALGTASPASISGGYGTFTVNGSNGGGFALQRAGTSQGFIYVDSLGLQYSAVSTNPHIWYNNGSEQMRLTSTGLHLGTTFTSISNRLQVAGNAAIGYTTAAPTTGLIVAGNVGIGADSPGSKLDVSGANAGTVLAARILNTSTSASSDAQQFIYVNGATAGDAYTTWTVGGVTSWSGGIRNSDSDSWYLSPGSNLGTSPAVVVTTSGNLGLGVTPNANWVYRVMQVGTTAAFGGNQSFNRAYMFSNVYWDGSNYKYLTTGPSPATWYEQSDGAHYWFRAASGSGGATISQIQAMTLDTSGNLLVGTTSTSLENSRSFEWIGSSGGVFRVNHSTSNGSGDPYFQFGYNASQIGAISQSGTTALSVGSANELVLCAGGVTTERAQLTSGGIFAVANGNQVTNTASSEIYFGNKGYFSNSTIGAAAIKGISTGANWYSGTALAFFTNPGPDVTGVSAVERARIDSSGTLILRQSSNAANTSVSFNTTVQNALTLDSSGNLGLGVTPSAWNSNRLALQISGANGGYVTADNGLAIASNYAFVSGDKFVADGYAPLYFMSKGAGSHQWYISNNNSSGAGIAISFTQAMTLDASGNLSVGTTSNLLSAASRVTVSVNGTSSSAIAFGVGDTRRGHIYVDGTETVFAAGQNGQSQIMALQVNGAERARITSGGQFAMTNDGTNAAPAISFTNDLDTGIFRPTTNQLGFATAGVQAMTLDASGNLALGSTSTPTGQAADNRVIQIYGAGTANRAQIHFCNSDTGETATDGSFIGIDVNKSLFIINRENADIVFNNNGTERARITSGGYFKASNDGNYQNSAAAYHELRQSASDWIAYVVNSNATPYGINLGHITDANSTGSPFLACNAGAALGTLRAEIRSNGGLANYQSNNVDLSDVRTKTDINPVASCWSKIAALEIVSYRYKDQTHDDLNIGVIAQQVEQVAPEFVDADGFGETPEDGVPLKTIYNKDLTFAAIKALQEAMARIEQLEAKVAALEAK